MPPKELRIIFVKNDDKNYEKSLRRAYLNKRNLKRRIRNQEKYIARNLVYPAILSPNGRFKDKFNLDLEYFFTWAIKIPTSPKYMWCDRAQVKSLDQVGKRTFIINAWLWLAEEKEKYSAMRRCECYGRVTLNSSSKNIKCYYFQIEDKEKVYHVKKKA